jgi:hypothetical protein
MKPNSGIPLSEWSGSGATRELHETIKLQIEATDRQSKLITRLTWFMAVLAVIQTIAAVFQVIPVLQSTQDKGATNKLPETATQLQKQENQPPMLTLGNPVEVQLQKAPPPIQGKKSPP